MAGLAASYDNLGQLHARTDLEQAIRDCSHAIEIQETLCRSHSEILKYRSDLAVNYSNLGAIQGRGGRFQQARASYLKALEIQEDLVRKSASVAEYVLELAVTHNNLGQLCLSHHDLPNAWKSFQDAKTHLDGLVENYPKEINYRSTLGGTLNNLGMTFEKLGRLDEALPAYREAIKQQRAVMEIAPSVARFREFLGVQYGNFGRSSSRRPAASRRPSRRPWRGSGCGPRIPIGCSRSPPMQPPRCSASMRQGRRFPRTRPRLRRRSPISPSRLCGKPYRPGWTVRKCSATPRISAPSAGIRGTAS